MKHIHAELMAEYAKDAMETDKPWERWEIKAADGVWHSITTEFSFYSNLKYRRKPNGKVAVIDGQEFIVPKSFKPNTGDFYFCFRVAHADVEQYKYKDTLSDWERVRSGICYRTQEEAKQALKFWQAINEA